MIDHQEILKAAKQVVSEASQIIVRDWDQPRHIRHKGRIDLVTATDIAVEKVLVNGLAPLIPQATFLTEEGAPTQEPGKATWVIDPLDGTTNFAHGLPFVAISVALWENDSVTLGIVALPILKELFWAVKGQGAFCNNQPIQVSNTDDLEQSLVATGFPYRLEGRIDTVLSQLKTMLMHAQGVRRPGSAALDLAYTACGRFDGFYEVGLNSWDTAAGWLLVEEAGGRVSQYHAASPYHLKADTILVSNGRIHSAMSRLLLEE